MKSKHSKCYFLTSWSAQQDQRSIRRGQLATSFSSIVFPTNRITFGLVNKCAQAFYRQNRVTNSVVDPDPQDPYVFGFHGSGSFLLFCDFMTFLSYKNDKNVYSKIKKQKNLNQFFGVLQVKDEKAGSGSISERHGSADLYQHVTDPQHW